MWFGELRHMLINGATTVGVWHSKYPRLNVIKPSLLDLCSQSTARSSMRIRPVAVAAAAHVPYFIFGFQETQVMADDRS
jgi:hypothetical protein